MLKAGFSEEELKSLERRFAAPRGANAGALAYRGRGAGAGEAGVRFVELLHWGAPRRPSSEGNEEVCACFSVRAQFLVPTASNLNEVQSEG